MRSAEGDVLDVAIVGGGVAGAYCAWRLLADGRRGAKVALFEGSGRIGGRLLSLRPPGMDRLVCDLGGAYFANIHRHVASLVDHLALAREPIPAPMRNVFHLRGARFRPRDAQVPYALDSGGGHRDLLFGRAVERLLPGATSVAPGELDGLLRAAHVDGRPLADWGFWNLLAHGMTAEEHRYLRDSRPDDYNLLNWNAADALRGLLVFGRDTRMFHLRDGYAHLPHTLGAQARDAGARVVAHHRLRAIEVEGDGLLRLHFARGGAGWGPAGGGESHPVRARAVVLAMPRRSLELLDSGNPVFASARAAALLASVTPIPMFKAFACYPAPWWRELGFESGLAITDLPLRTTFYWGTEASQRSLLMASLSYGVESSYWSALRERAPIDRGASWGARLAHPEWDDFASAPGSPLVRELQRQLSLVHGIDVPPADAAASMDWSLDPFGGAVNFWNPGARSEDILPAMAKPAPDLPVYVCGESYSRTQGWVEGALESAEHVLQSHFALPRPSWLAAAPGNPHA